MVLGSLASGIVGCSDATGPRQLPDVSAFVTGNALAALDDAGRFVFPDSVRTDGQARIDLERAKDLALSAVRTFWTFGVALNDPSDEGFRKFIELQRGAAVDSAFLKTESRVVWAYSAYSIPESAPRFIQRRSGPYAIVRLVERSVPVITVAVSALTTTYEIDVQGRLIMDSYVSGDGEGFHVMGISVDALYEDPVSPEEAVEAAYEASGRRVAAPPILLFPPFRFGLDFAKWRIEFEFPVTIITEDGDELMTSVLYVGWWPGASRTEFFVPAAEQPADWRAPWTDPATGESTLVIVPVRGDIPVEFVRVIMVR
jgi:hypothetical protein